MTPDLIHAVVGVKFGQPESDGRADIGNVAIDQERGTPEARHPIPPRSFLGAAAFRHAGTAANAIGARVAWAVAGLPPGDNPR